MSKMFLHGVAQSLWDKFGDAISDVIVLLPNTRSGLYIEKELARIAGKPIWSPEFCSISNWTNIQSSLVKGNELALMFELYEAYQEVFGKEELAVFWQSGRVILQDFEAIDKYLVDAEELFAQSMGYIPTEYAEGITEKFVNLWDGLGEVYQSFQKRLIEKGLAYQGMIWRDLIENKNLVVDKPMAVVGFNWLSPAQVCIFKEIQKNGGLFYWQEIPSIVEKRNPARGFMMDNLKQFKNELSPVAEDEMGQEKKLNVISLPSVNAQAAYVGNQLAQHEGDYEDVGVILPTDRLMEVVVHALPERINKINVAMGVAYQASPIYPFLEALFDLAEQSFWEQEEVCFKTKYLRNVTSDHYIQTVWKIDRSIFSQEPTLIFSSFKTFRDVSPCFELLEDLLNEEVSHFGHRLQRFLTVVYNELLASETPLSNLHLQSLFAVLAEINAVIPYLKNVEYGEGENPVASEIALVRQFVKDIVIPFKGEATKGLQVLGHLEALNLPFKEIYFLSQNEGVFPAAKLNSIIPFDLRRMYGMPTNKELAAAKWFEFYATILYPEKVNLLYVDGASDSIGSREKNRYIQALELLDMPIKITEDIKVNSGVVSAFKNDSEVILNAEQKQKIIDYLTGPGLSPSSFNTLLSCEVKFLYDRLYRSQVQDYLDEEVDAARFGNIFHDSLEHLYKPLTTEKTIITKEVIGRLLKQAEEVVSKYVMSYLKLNQLNIQQGYPFILRKYITRLVKKVLNYDLKHVPFYIYKLEEKYKMPLQLDEGFMIYINGTIDRIDFKEGHLRLIDYKTKSKIIDKVDWEKLINEENQYPTFTQLLFYGALWRHAKPFEVKQVEVVIFDSIAPNSAQVGKPFFVDKNRLEDYDDKWAVRARDFIGAKIKTFIEKDAYRRTTDARICSFCDYKDICVKGRL